MKILKIPYIPQININACGAAVLEMVYKYYGLKDISQQELMDKYQELEPHGSGNFMMTTDNLIQDARARGFNAWWAKANYLSAQDSISLLKLLVEKNGVPVIVCQKFSEQEPLIGHFRIVVGIDDDSVYLYDPYVKLDGSKLQWSVNKFMEFWQPTGQNVTGGIFCFISK